MKQLKQIFLVFALMMIMVDVGWGQGSETFTNSSLTASYANGNFTGDNSVVWTYIESRDESTYGITGKGIMLRYNSPTLSKVTSSSVAGGVGNFTCSLKKAFTGSGNRQVQLFINGVSKGSSIAWDNTTVQTFTVNNINVSGSITIEIRNITANQVIVDDISWTGYVSSTAPPTLSPDATSNNVDNNIDITFTPNSTWESAITAVKIGGTALTLTTDYVITSGNIQLKPSGLNTLLTTSGSKTVTVEATGYTTASVTQVINPGADNNLLIFTQPTAPAVNGGTLGTQPIIKIRDQYNNTTTSTANVVASVGSGTWTIGGTTSKAGVSGTATFTNLTATSVGAVTGAISFTCGSLPVVTSNTFNIPAPIALGWQITAPNSLFTIDFDNTVSGVNNGQFAGSGFQPTPTTGQLNSNAWAVTGWSDGDLAFGGTRTVSSDYTRGTSTGGVSTGGIYAFTVSGNNTLGFQPGSGDWAPGTVTLKFQNSSGADVTSLLISYKVYVRNDQGRSSIFNFSHSSDNSTYTSATNLDLTSPVASDAAGWKTYIRTVNVTGLSISNGSFYYLRWSGADVGGSGSRDEFALDDIQLVANSTSIVPTLVGTIEDAVIDGITNLSGNATISSSLNLISNTLSIGANTLTLNGTVTSTSGSITGGTSSNLTIGGTGALGTLVFTSGARELQNLVINRTSSGTVTLGTDLLVNTLLTLTSGILNTDATNKLTLGTDATISGGSATSFVNGPLNLNTNTTSLKTVHIGSGSTYRTVGITPSTTDATTYTIQFFNSGQSLGNTYLSPLVNVSSLEYFDIDRSAGTSNAKVTLSWSSNSGITNLTDLRVAHWNSINSRWESVGVDGFTGTETSGTITSTVVSSFSPFVLGSVSNQPLPIVLSSFNSNYVGRNIKLTWVTASENNNAGFEVERIQSSEIGIQNWGKIGYVNGHGTVNTPTNYSFEDKNLQTGKYKYRLKQIDHNGNYEYFELNGEVEIGVPKKYDLSQNYPNPFNPVTKINFDLPVDSKVTMLIYDITGREVAKLLNGEFKKAGYHTTNFNGSALSSGVYFYSLSTDAFRMTKKMLMIK